MPRPRPSSIFFARAFIVPKSFYKVSQDPSGAKPKKFWQNPWLRAAFLVFMLVTLWAAWPNFNNFGQVSEDRKLAIYELNLKRDFDYYWLEIECLTPQEGLDCSGWHLLDGSQERIVQAKPRASIQNKQSLIFYLPKEQLQQTLQLNTSHGKLAIKSKSGLPQLENTQQQTIKNPQWP